MSKAAFPTVIIGLAPKFALQQKREVKVIKLKGQKTVAVTRCTQHCLPEVPQTLRVRDTLHHDNASSHTAAFTVNFLKENNLLVSEHPPYSPELATCEFWLSFDLKKCVVTVFHQKKRTSPLLLNILTLFLLTIDAMLSVVEGE
ncbi:hypothetical protein EVAR_102639_1 [Eumeta japonica]|uniref:Mariner Mos1 transposase n=1 Tax=Eumeta variegata TaxID=151549 RepID=A0A4C1TUV7_EUMVA|nr:hypothetical protein EVAR_102639_1 [Eumeta japonica]